MERSSKRQRRISSVPSLLERMTTDQFLELLDLLDLPAIARLCRTSKTFAARCRQPSTILLLGRKRAQREAERAAERERIRQMVRDEGDINAAYSLVKSGRCVVLSGDPTDVFEYHPESQIVYTHALLCPDGNGVWVQVMTDALVPLASRTIPFGTWPDLTFYTYLTEMVEDLDFTVDLELTWRYRHSFI